MCCRFVFIDRRFGLNSLEGKDKYSETDGAAEKKINPYRYSLCRNMISFTSLFLKGNSYLEDECFPNKQVFNRRSGVKS